MIASVTVHPPWFVRFLRFLLALVKFPLLVRKLARLQEEVATAEGARDDLTREVIRLSRLVTALETRRQELQ